MKKRSFIVQYVTQSVNGPVAVSDWPERTKTIKADSAQAAIEKFEHNRAGTWMILDCYPE